ncbi:Selenocysteine lyase [Smittium culicis]|uniref:Selenocysteine lyase n=1 Tax=Smittium culicis TaxID=133412 RepID=A0A1R1Y7B6_9FUNG|nr:Selenocysteine lyase [Smittium culicis]
MDVSGYFNFQATTPLASEVSKSIYESCLNEWGNPSSNDVFGQRYNWKFSKASINRSRAQVARLIGSKPEDIIFTSGGTESNNIAIISAYEHYIENHKQNSNFDTSSNLPHFIISNIEHPAVLEPIKHLMNKNLISVSYLPTKSNGSVDIESIKKHLTEYKNIAMISVMLVNNETGVINDIKSLVEIVRSFEKNFKSKKNSGMSRILIHTDAAQAIGKIRVDVSELGIDYLTVVGHKSFTLLLFPKIYGPRIGALYAKSPSKYTPVYPIVHGADQERGFRPGTENTPMIAGLGVACGLISENLDSYIKHYLDMTNYFKQQIIEFKPVDFLKISYAHDNSSKIIPNTLNFSVSFLNNQPNCLNEKLYNSDLSDLLSNYKIYIGKGSACHSGLKVNSPVLSAMGMSPENMSTSLRFSVGRETNYSHIDNFVKTYWDVVLSLVRSEV